jgi:hypothetical protein
MGALKNKLSKVRKEVRESNRKEDTNLKAVIVNNEVVVRERMVRGRPGNGFNSPRKSGAGSSRSLYLQHIRKLVLRVIPKRTVFKKDMESHTLVAAYELPSTVVKREVTKVISHVRGSSVHNIDRNKRKRKNKEASRMRKINS